MHRNRATFLSTASAVTLPVATAFCFAPQRTFELLGVASKYTDVGGFLGAMLFSVLTYVYSIGASTKDLKTQKSVVFLSSTCCTVGFFWNLHKFLTNQLGREIWFANVPNLIFSLWGWSSYFLGEQRAIV